MVVAKSVNKISYMSSNDSIAKVNKEGTVEALNPGKAEITAKSSQGYSKCTINVLSSDLNNRLYDSNGISIKKVNADGTKVNGFVSQAKGQNFTVMVDGIDESNVKSCKWSVGNSDVVSKLSAVSGSKLKATLKAALFGEKLAYQIPAKSHDIQGKARGILVGGNISILYSLLGSKSSIDTRGKILFIEDLDEYLYHIDRMMYNLKRNGYFDQVKGIIVGSMTDMHDNEIPFGQNEVQIITAIAQSYNIPIVFEFPAGHQRDNRTLILGSLVDFEVNSTNVILRFY
jgi:hypothetical protein